MASLLSPSPPPSTILLKQKVNLLNFNFVSTNPSIRSCRMVGKIDKFNGICSTTRAKMTIEGDVLEKDEEPIKFDEENDFGVVGVHHVGVLCENLERSLHFYLNILGLKINDARPHDKLPYRGAWLWVGSEMIHLMELPNPDPLSGRPEHGGRDRHACIAVRDVSKLKVILDEAGIPYTLSRSGRPAIFTRDPDANALEFTQVDD